MHMHGAQHPSLTVLKDLSSASARCFQAKQQVAAVLLSSTAATLHLLPVPASLPPRQIHLCHCLTATPITPGLKGRRTLRGPGHCRL